MNRHLRPSSLLAPLLGLAAIALAAPADAVGTRTFELASLDDLSGGDLTGTSVDSLGRVRAGLTLGHVALSDANAVWSALALPNGDVVLGTGNTGKILKIANGQASVAADTGQLAVTSLVTGFGGAIFAATIPHGRIVKLDANLQPTTFVDLPDADHVWALAFDAKQNALYAATGPHGKLFRIDASGKAQVHFDSEEPHLVSLALAPDGSVWAGSSGKAILYKIAAPGRATVVHDFPGDEVKAIAFGEKGIAYAIANEFPEPPEIPKRATAAAVTPAGPVSAARPKPGKGQLARFDAEGRYERMMKRDDTHFVSLAVGEDGRPYVGTGVEGRVYSVDDAHTTTLVADTDARQVSVLSLTGKRRFLATSDPPSFDEIRGTGGPDAVWTSKVLDATLRARFGRLSWHATGVVEMSTRSGNTQTPDATWSDWSAAMPAPGPIASPPGRFVQVRARFSRDPNAVISEVLVPFVTDNVRPIVTSVDAAPKGVTPPKPQADMPPASGGEPPAHTATLKVTWKVDDPDADPLRYRLSYKLEGQPTWRDLTRPDEVVTKTEYEWDTSTLPEGWYRVRVDASDEPANPPDRAFHHALESGLVAIDNTAPVFRALAANGRKITGEAVDGLGPIARVDVSFDGRSDWKPIAAKDGVFDEAAEAFEADLASLVGPGSHLVAVRAFDQAGNAVVRWVELK